MRWLNPSAVLNFRKPSMDFAKESAVFGFVEPGALRFIRNSSIFGKMSTAVRRANEKPEPDGLWFTLSSGEWIRTTDLRVMSPTSYRCSTPHREVEYTPSRYARQVRMFLMKALYKGWIRLVQVRIYPAVLLRDKFRHPVHDLVRHFLAGISVERHVFSL